MNQVNFSSVKERFDVTLGMTNINLGDWDLDKKQIEDSVTWA